MAYQGGRGGQRSAARAAGASRIYQTYARQEDRTPTLAGMMSFDHMSPEETTAWKKDYGRYRAGKKKRDEEREVYERKMRRGY